MIEGKDEELKITEREEKISVEPKDNIVDIAKGEQRYRVVYGIHIIPTDPRDIPTETEGVFVEMNENYADYATYEMWAEYYMKDARAKIQYRDIIAKLERRETPIYFGDVDISILTGIKEYLPVIIETMIGKELLKYAISVDRKKISRRAFLKGVAGLTGIWLTANPFTSSLVRFGSSLSGVAENKTASLLSRAAKLHPETQLTFFNSVRNVVLAEKMEWLKKAHLTTLIGTAHVGIVDQLVHSSEERLKFLESLAPSLKQLPSPETLYTIIGFNYDNRNDRWEVEEKYEVSKLKELIS